MYIVYMAETSVMVHTKATSAISRASATGMAGVAMAVLVSVGEKW